MAVQALALGGVLHLGHDHELVAGLEAGQRSRPSVSVATSRSRPLSVAECRVRGLTSRNVSVSESVQAKVIRVVEAKVSGPVVRSNSARYAETVRRSAREIASVCVRLGI